jgi:phage baseplate assembly protein V
VRSEADHARLLSSVIMLGVIAELDEAAARVRVDADGLRTDWLPWCEHRAGPGARTWAPPEVGEQVVIACPYGDSSQAIVLGSVYQQAYPAPAGSKTVHRATYPDGTVIEYNRESSTLTINAGSGSVIINCATATIAASESVTLDTPNLHATGDVSVHGNVNIQGDATAQGEVKAGSIGLKSHHHTAQGPTAPTSTAQA